MSSQPEPLPSPDKDRLKRTIAELEESNSKKDVEIQQWKENSEYQSGMVTKATGATNRIKVASYNTEARLTKLNKENSKMQQRITGLVTENTNLKADVVAMKKQRDDAIAKLARLTSRGSGGAAEAASGMAGGGKGEGNKPDDLVSLLWLIVFVFV